MATVMTNLSKTKVAGVAWDTPFPVKVELDPSITEINGWKLVWKAEKETAPNVYADDTTIVWPLQGDTIELHSTDDLVDPVINYFTVSETVFNGMTDKKRYFSVQLINNAKRVVQTSARLPIEFKKLQSELPFTADRAYATAGGDLAQSDQSILFTATVYDTTGAPVDGMQVDFSMLLDPQTAGVKFSLVGDTTQSYNIPTVLTSGGEASLVMTCETSHYITLQASATGSPEGSAQSVAFVKIGDGVPINPAPAITLNGKSFTINEGAYTFAATLSPSKKLLNNDTIFVVVNNKLSYVMSGAEFTSSVELPIADLNIEDNIDANHVAYYVESADGVVTASKDMSFGVKGTYVNKPDPSITYRPMPAPSLYPALAADKVLTDDYLNIVKSAVSQPLGITVKIPALPAGSPEINKDLVVNFYLNGYDDKYHEKVVTGFKQKTGIKGKATAQYVTLEAAEARGYGVSSYGKYQYFYCEYFYKGSDNVYSGYIAYKLDTTRP
jgi:hypothetical protein